MRMDKIVLSTIIATALTLVGYGWDFGEPMTYTSACPGWRGHPSRLTDKDAADMKAAGYNTVVVMTKAELDVCQRHGLRGAFYLGLPRDHALTPADRKRIAKLIGEVKDHPALYVYRHTDEPSAAWFSYLVEGKEFVRSLDPTHPTWVNLLPTYANNKQLGVYGEDMINAYKVHVDSFIYEYQPVFLSYDHYQMTRGGDTTNYFYNLEIVRERCEKANIPLINGVQACSWVPGSLASPRAPRIPNVDELRYLVYTTLAFGCQGIYYYVYSFPKHEGAIVDMDGKKSDKYEALKTLNPAFIAIAKQLRGMKFKGAFAHNYAAKGLKAYGDEAILKLEGANGPVLVSRFDACDGEKKFMVVNLDYNNETAFKITAPKALEAFDEATGSWSAFDGNLKLRKGVGILLRTL